MSIADSRLAFSLQRADLSKAWQSGQGPCWTSAIIHVSSMRVKGMKWDGGVSVCLNKSSCVHGAIIIFM